MASLAFTASIVFLSILLVGPFTYLLARLKFPKFIVYLFSFLSLISGLWFVTIGLPVWYIGLLPIYCAYISINRINKTVEIQEILQSRKRNVDNAD